MAHLKPILIKIANRPNFKGLSLFLLSPISAFLCGNTFAAPSVAVYGTNYGPEFYTNGPYLSTPGTISVSDGGKLYWTSGVTIGRWGGAKSVILDGEGSTFTGSSYVIIGDDKAGGGSNGVVKVTNGAKFTSTGFSFGRVPNDVTSLVVSGDKSELTTSGNITIGRDGDVTASVSDGASITAKSLGIGSPALAVPTRMSVSDATLNAEDTAIGRSTTTLNNNAAIISNNLSFTSKDGAIFVGDGLSNAKFDVKNVSFTTPGTVTFNNIDDSEVSSNFSGKGNIVKSGASKLSLSGDNSNFSGTFNVNDGTASTTGVFGTSESLISVASGANFQGDGSIRGDVFVSSGGRFNYGGTVKGSLNIDPAATLQISGNDLSSLIVNDNLKISGLYKVRLDPRSDISDLLQTSQAAVLNSSSILEVSKFRSGDYVPGAEYHILQADAGVSGQFGTLSGDIGSRYLYLRPVYAANDVYLVVDKLGAGFVSDAATDNQRSTANGLFDNRNRQSGLWQSFATLNSGGQARYALDQLSGDFYSSAWSAAIDESDIYRRVVNRRLIQASYEDFDKAANGEPIKSLSNQSNWSPWIAPYGSRSKFDQSKEAGGLTSSSNGFIFGVDGAVNETWRVGAAAAAGTSKFSSSSRNSSSRGEQYQLGIFAGAQWDKIKFRAGISQSLSDLKSKRSVAFDGFSDKSKSSFDINTTQVFGEVSYDLKYRNIDIAPFAGLAYVDADIDKIKEKGGDSRLNVDGIHQSVSFATLGSRAGTKFKLGKWDGKVQGSLGYRHAMGGRYATSTSSFAEGGGTFEAEGVQLARNMAITDLTFEVSPTKLITTGVSYQGKFGSDSHENSLVASIQLKF